MHLNMRMAILCYIRMTVLMDDSIEGIAGDSAEIPCGIHGRVRSAEDYSVGVKRM